MTDTYTFPHECSNCQQKHDATIPKGEEAKGDRECPNCGCKTAKPVRREKESRALVNPWPDPIRYAGSPTMDGYVPVLGNTARGGN